MERKWSVSIPCRTLEELVGLYEHRPYRYDRNFHPHPKLMAATALTRHCHELLAEQLNLFF